MFCKYSRAVQNECGPKYNPNISDRKQELFLENDEEDINDKVSQRIINGKSVKISEYPFYVLIDTERCYCGGALLSEDTILTAAHCVAKSPLHKIKVTPGLNYWTQTKRNIYHPRKVIIHPKYKKDKAYDIALVILSTNVKLCGCVDIIDIGEWSPKVGEEVTVVGYGYTKYTRKNGKCVPAPSKRLKASYRKIVSYDGPVMNTYSKETRTCLGDSGSPVICNGELVGIHVGGEWFCGSTSYHITLAHPKIYSFVTEHMCNIED